MTNSPILSSRILLYISTLFIIIVLQTSCGLTHYDDLGYHVPQEGQLLGISEKGEIKGSGAGYFAISDSRRDFSPTNPFGERMDNYLSVTGGYGFHKHFAAQGNLLWVGYQSPESSETYFSQTFSVGSFYKREYKRSRRSILKKKVVLGDSISVRDLHYYTVDKRRVTRVWDRVFLMDAYIGLGYGENRKLYKEAFQGSWLRLNFMRTYLHGGFKWDSGRLFELGFATKLVYTDHLRLRQHDDIPENDFQGLRRILNSDPFFHFEITPKFRFGKEYANVYFSSTFIPYNYSFMNPSGRYDSYFLGVEFSISGIREIKEKKKLKKNANL